MGKYLKSVKLTIFKKKKKLCSAKGVAGWAHGWEYKQVDLMGAT